jgi:hypothetical protein
LEAFGEVMKRMIKLFTLAVLATVFAAPVLAQDKDCTDENKAAWYQKFLDNRKGEAAQQKVAYDAAQSYLKCSTDLSEQIPAYLKKWVDQYDKVMGASKTIDQFNKAVTDKSYAEQVRLGKEIVANEPDNSAVYIIMGTAGLGEQSLMGESAGFAKKAIELVEAGKPFKPYNTKDQALAALNYVIARSMLTSNPGDAIPYFLKAARYDSDLKKNAQLYLELNAAYSDGPGKKLTEDYKSKIGPNNTETPESKLALANLYQIVDRQIDSLARAAALADAAHKKDIMDALTDLYKYRNNNKTDGVNELVASVLTKPIPDLPTPLTSLPSTPSSTPGTTSGASGNGTAATTPTNGAKKPR